MFTDKRMVSLSSSMTDGYILSIVNKTKYSVYLGQGSFFLTNANKTDSNNLLLKVK